MVKLNVWKYVNVIFLGKDIDLLSLRNCNVKLWVVFKKMYEVLGLKINLIYFFGMVYW